MGLRKYVGRIVPISCALFALAASSYAHAQERPAFTIKMNGQFRERGGKSHLIDNTIEIFKNKSVKLSERGFWKLDAPTIFNTTLNGKAESIVVSHTVTCNGHLIKSAPNEVSLQSSLTGEVYKHKLRNFWAEYVNSPHCNGHRVSVEGWDEVTVTLAGGSCRFSLQRKLVKKGEGTFENHSAGWTVGGPCTTSGSLSEIR